MSSIILILNIIAPLLLTFLQIGTIGGTNTLTHQGLLHYSPKLAPGGAKRHNIMPLAKTTTNLNSNNGQQMTKISSNSLQIARKNSNSPQTFVPKAASTSLVDDFLSNEGYEKSELNGKHQNVDHFGQNNVEDTHLKHFAELDISQQPHAVRKTGIICTIGPTSRSVEMLAKLIENGMNIARLNFSHGDHEYHAGTIKNIREAVASFSPPKMVAIALDTKGPEIRTGVLFGGDASAEVMLEKGAKILLTTDASFAETSTASHVYVDYRNLPKVVSMGSRVYIDDGLISLIVEKILDDAIECTIENGGRLGSRKGVNLPGTVVDLPAVSEKDMRDLQFGVEMDVDIVFASFIRNAAGISAIREVLGERGKHIKVIAKIENQEGIEKADEIIAASDGVMVARGDLGIEIAAAKVPLAQKMLTAKCNMAGKPVICATHMLESMVSNPRPTRAEAGDVANAVLEGADCVMLSGETAKGQYPVESLLKMHSICKEAERAFHHSKFLGELLLAAHPAKGSRDALALAATSAAAAAGAAAIILIDNTGSTAQLCARYRPSMPIVALTRNARVARQLQLFRGVLPMFYWQPDANNKDPDADSEAEEPINFGDQYLDSRMDAGLAAGDYHQFIQSGDTVVIVGQWSTESGANSINDIRLHTVQ